MYIENLKKRSDCFILGTVISNQLCKRQNTPKTYGQ